MPTQIALLVGNLLQDDLSERDRRLEDPAALGGIQGERAIEGVGVGGTVKGNFDHAGRCPAAQVEVGGCGRQRPPADLTLCHGHGGRDAGGAAASAADRCW